MVDEFKLANLEPLVISKPWSIDRAWNETELEHLKHCHTRYVSQLERHELEEISEEEEKELGSLRRKSEIWSRTSDQVDAMLFERAGGKVEEWDLAIYVGTRIMYTINGKSPWNNGRFGTVIGTRQIDDPTDPYVAPLVCWDAAPTGPAAAPSASSGSTSSAATTTTSVALHTITEPLPIYRWTVPYRDGRTLCAFPMINAAAMTIHRSQGKTLPTVITDLSNIFEYGQVYTVLSRARRLCDVYILNSMTQKTPLCHPDIAQFLQTMSKRSDSDSKSDSKSSSMSLRVSIRRIGTVALVVLEFVIVFDLLSIVVHLVLHDIVTSTSPIDCSLNPRHSPTHAFVVLQH